MKRLQFFFALGTGAALVLINIYGFSLLRQRANLPEGTIPDGIIESKSIQLKVDGYDILYLTDLEFVLSRKKSGDQVWVEFISLETSEKNLITLVHHYSDVPFHIIYLIIGLSFIFIGTFVFSAKKEDIKARLFYWATLTLASAIVLSGGYHCLRDSWVSYLPGIVFYACYALTPAILLRFSLSFSSRLFGRKKLLIYIPSLCFIGVLEFLFLASATVVSLEIYRWYQNAMYAFRYYILTYFILSIVFLLVSYKKTNFMKQRAQIKWILYGLFVGMGPFVFLYLLFRLLRLDPVLSEEISMAFPLFIPIAIAIAIVKHKLLDIELVLNRSLVYSSLTIFIVGVYLFLTRILQNLFSRFFYVQDVVITATAAFGAALAFHPARRYIQNFVDKTFFRLSYDYRQRIFYFNEHAHRIVEQERLVDFFKEQVMEVLPVDYFGFLVTSHSLEKQHSLIISAEGKDLMPLLTQISGDKIQAGKKSVFVDEDMDFSLEEEMKEKGIELILPIASNAHVVRGGLFLGKKKSGERYRRDDIELLRAFIEGTLVNLERINLQEEVVYERAEKEKLDEVNRLKSEFITSVSHELRTPMTTIRSLTELLQSGKIKEKSKRDDLLGIMYNECNRLSRFLHNILDMGKIEQDAKTYEFSDLDMKSLIQETVKLFEYRIKKEGFKCKLHFPEKPVFMHGDRDAIQQALTNIIDNAIKYSTKNKQVDVYLAPQDNKIEVKIEDKGIGIPLEEQELIFKEFYRGTRAQKKDPSGVGIGLKIVGHIMSAHGGEVKIESQPEEGTSVSLIFKTHAKSTIDRG